MNAITDMTFRSATEEERSSSVLQSYLTICKRRWWVIGVCAIGAAVLAAGWSFYVKPIYQAKATVVIQQEGGDGLERERGRVLDASPEYVQTHFELLRSHHVLKETAARVKLSEQVEYRGFSDASGESRSVSLRKTIDQMIGVAPPKPTEAQAIQEDLLLRRFSERIQILPVRGARLAHVIVMAENPEFAALAANTLVSVYSERAQDLNQQTKESVLQWYTSHLNELRGKVEASQQALYLFRAKHGLLQAQERQAVATSKVAELNSELVKAEMKKAELQVRLQHLQGVLLNRQQNGALAWSKLDATTEVLASPLIQTLRAQEIKDSGLVAELSDKYGALHPKMARAEAELHDLRGRIQEEFRKIYDSVKQEYETAVTRERRIKETVTRHNTDKINDEKYEIEHGILEREAQSSQHLYEVFLKVMKEADLAMGMRTNNISLADPAVSSLIPVRPQKTLNTLMGFFVGLMSGTALAFVLDARDRSLKSPIDIERYLPTTSLLGVIPRLAGSAEGHEALLLNSHSTGPMAESYRTIRASLLLSNTSQLPSCVLITSPGANEGKTTLAVNLASAVSHLEGKRVLLIDADLRHPTPHPIFMVDRKNASPKGLKHFLAGEAEPWDIICPTENSNLWVVPRGDRSVTAAELLSSPQMNKLLRWCRAEGFHILIDAPPVLPVTDAVVIGMQVDGVLMVVSAGQTTLEASRLALRRLSTAGCNVLGIVMQKARLTDIPYSTSYFANIEGS